MTWQPDWTVAAGETLDEVLEERGWTQTLLADQTGFSLKHVNRVIKGHEWISVEFALALEDTLDIPAEFWLRLDVPRRVQDAKRSAVSR